MLPTDAIIEYNNTPVILLLFATNHSSPASTNPAAINHKTSKIQEITKRVILIVYNISINLTPNTKTVLKDILP